MPAEKARLRERRVVSGPHPPRRTAAFAIHHDVKEGVGEERRNGASAPFPECAEPDPSQECPKGEEREVGLQRPGRQRKEQTLVEGVSQRRKKNRPDTAQAVQAALNVTAVEEFLRTPYQGRDRREARPLSGNQAELKMPAVEETKTDSCSTPEERRENGSR